ncbi:hypothetical protein SmJEL517_g00129 [Synchytrium microbalum]|uniref:Structural maintenance of chromosomes protein 5 n=1 Tax=Synchytrium microbalum TaxID=1806994 RepID=A0A507CJR6_9FUNG|nr:uncharacterized protein SmJEL517_g00129 [Synchytrium microbalum]TPX38085.1 hypothetical protein SmJEL517_g00129 [Synchytrium microbalum]
MTRRITDTDTEPITVNPGVRRQTMTSSIIENIDEVQEDSQRPRKKAKTAQSKNATRVAHDDGYADGSILRIKMKNFLTYNQAEFFPGPHLNMIIGPNGTGKSSVVAAIVTALGGRLKLLDRHDRSGDLVKNGETAAEVEIEIKHSRGNLTINRIYTKGANDSQFKINGKPSTLAEVKRRVAEMNIQMDNLCQCLPQEMVGEFAELNAQQRLKETQRCAGEADLTKWHQQLIEAKRTETDLAQAVQRERDSLADDKRRNEAIYARVQGFRNREAAVRQLDVLELIYQWILYDEAKQKALDKSAEVEILKAQLAEAKERNEPSRLRLELCKNQAAAAKTSKDKAIQQYEKACGDIDKKREEFDRKEGEADKLKLERNAAADGARRHDAEVARIQREIDNASRQRDQMRDELAALGLDVTSNQLIGGRLAQISAETEVVRNRTNTLEQERDTLTREDATIHNRIQESRQQEAICRDELAKLDNLELQKEHLLSNRPNTQIFARAMKWCQDNPNRFQGRVYKPAILEIKVTDPNVANQVESAIGFLPSMQIVATDTGDMNLLVNELVYNQKLRVAISDVPQRLRETNFAPQYTKEELRRAGFIGYAKDFIEGPEDPIAFKDADVKPDIAKNMGINSWITAESSVIFRKAYGSSNTTSTGIHPAQFLTLDVNADQRVDLQRSLGRLDASLKDDQARRQPTRDRLSQIEGQLRELRGQEQTLREERNGIFAKHKEYRAINGRLDAGNTSLRNKEKEAQGRTGRIAKLETNLSTIEKERFALAIELQNLRSLSTKMHVNENIPAQLAWHQAEADRQVADEEFQQLQASIQEKQIAVDQGKNQHQHLVQRRKAALANVKRTDGAFVDKHQARWSPEENALGERLQASAKLLEVPTSEINDLVTQARAAVEMNLNNDGNVVQEYEQRKARIEAAEVRLEESQEALSNHKQEMQAVRDLWVPEITALAAKINEKFSLLFKRIDCAGEVKVSENEDYDKWGIEILVCFRVGQDLKELRAKVQSGGERAVSTMLYLLALQEFSRAPFRVVDEINQGMDALNERMMHKLMVEGSNREGSAQYFLITPKLLPDLEFNERMKILCIYSGPVVPSRQQVVDAVSRKKKLENDQPPSDKENGGGRSSTDQEI